MSQGRWLHAGGWGDEWLVPVFSGNADVPCGEEVELAFAGRFQHNEIESMALPVLGGAAFLWAKK